MIWAPSRKESPPAESDAPRPVVQTGPSQAGVNRRGGASQGSAGALFASNNALETYQNSPGVGVVSFTLLGIELADIH